MSSRMTGVLDVEIPDPFPNRCRQTSLFNEGVVMKELKNGGSGKLEGTFEGKGVKLGEWDSYETFCSEDEGSRYSLFAGDLVELHGVDRKVVLVRILGSQKKGGAGGRTQASYMCLLYDDGASRRKRGSGPWLYATMPNVDPIGEDAGSQLMQKISSELTSFTPASVSGAVQQAGKHTPPERKKKRKQPKGEGIA